MSAMTLLTRRRFAVIGAAVAATFAVAPGCGTTPTRRATSFPSLVDNYLDQFSRRHPSIAAGNGLHAHDDALEDFSAGAIASEVGWLHGVSAQLDAIDPAPLSADESGRPAHPAGHRRRLAARSRQRENLDAQSDDLRVRDLRRRAQPDDDGVVAGAGAGAAGRREAAARAASFSRRRARTCATPPRVFVERAIVDVPRRVRSSVARSAAGVRRRARRGAAGPARGRGRRRAARSKPTRPSSRRGCCRAPPAGTRSAPRTSKRATARRS